MSTAVKDTLHPFDAARKAGREPFKVKNLAEAEFGRKEIRLAEQEMPGLMAIREQHRRDRPLDDAGKIVMTELKSLAKSRPKSRR